MISYPFRYERPSALPEALDLIREPGAKVLAGGMSLVPMMKLRLAAPEMLVDLGSVPGQKTVEAVNGHLRIGPMVTHYELESGQAVRSSCRLLALCASRIGDVQVRNVGTIGGSIAHADPAADYPAALLALDAEFVLTSASGQRTVRAEDFFVDTFTTALEPDELITEIRVPRDAANTGGTYEKKAQSASGFALVGIAARVKLDGGKISQARIGVTGLSGSAYRARASESLLEGTSGSPAEIQAAAATVADGVDASSDIHASADYRAHLARVYAARAITTALARAGAEA
jgi:aerobic carbon-monoxide dehydrogenase medium subunit